MIVRLLEDGRVVWRPEGGGAELMTLPAALRRAGNWEWLDIESCVVPGL